MLVLSRKLNQAIILSGGIRITVVAIRGNQVRLGIEAPESVGIMREEICPQGVAASEPNCVAVSPRSTQAPARDLERRDEAASSDWRPRRDRANPVRFSR
jgi:carbon storage regulator